MSPTRDRFADDLALNMPLGGMQLIEASAGTGKTYTIAGMYARLLVENDELAPSRILVMTFTRAATSELRQRLRQRIAACAEVAESLAKGAPLPDVDAVDWAAALLRRHLDTGAETAEAVHRRLRGVLDSMDEAAIFTIHGFCQRVLRDFAPWLDEVVPDAELEPGDRDLVEDFAADFWLRTAGSGNRLELEALHELADTPQALAGKIAGLVAFEGDIETSEPDAAVDATAAESLARARQQLLAVWQRRGDAAVRAFLDVLGQGGLNAGSYKPGKCQVQLQDLAAALHAGRMPDAGLLRKFSQRKMLKARNNGAEWFEGDEAFAAIDACLDAGQGIDDTRHALAAALVPRVVAEARAWLAARKRALLRQSYDDLVGALAHGLAGPRREQLAAALHRRFPVALLDEFQDTDARQFGIFDAIYASRGGLVMIGDPKQAIYGFRGGDLHAYLRVADRKHEVRKHSLHRNYRSSPAMLAAVEALFTQSKDPFLDQRVAFGHVEAGGKVADGELRLGGKLVAPLTLWPKPKGLGADDLRETMANACAAQISTLIRTGELHGQPLQHGRIAVLANTNKEVVLVQNALSGLGIASACARQESIYATREARELLCLFDALLAPQSMPLARAALATRLLGRRLSDLAAMVADAVAWRTALDELAGLRTRWFGRGVLAMLERVGERHAARLLALPRGERIVGNLLQLGEALQADVHGLAGERALRDRLARRIADADEHNEEEQLRLESDAERVQVMTLHRSKGLEFDVVLLPFACLMKASDARQGHVLDLHRGDARVKYWLLNGSARRNAADKAAIEAAQHDAEAERLRCFYVGVTRARHACWLSSGDGEVFAQLLHGDESGTALAAVHDDIVVQEPPARGRRVAAPRHGRLRGARRFDGHVVRDWRRHSFSALTRGEHDYGVGKRDEVDLDDGDDNAAREVIGLPGGTRFGTAVHAILEKTDFAAWRDRVDAAPGDQSLVERELRAQGFTGLRAPGDVADATARLVAATLNAEIAPGLRLADLPGEARRAELEFDFGIDGVDASRVLALLHEAGYQRGRDAFAGVGTRLRGLMNGIIDLVFVHEGRWYIVDYKTNRLGRHYRDYAPERLRDAVAVGDYDLQYLIYTVALHRWLRRTPGANWDYRRDFGGVLYLFLRGLRTETGAAFGVHTDRPSPQLVEALDACLGAEPAP